MVKLKEYICAKIDHYKDIGKTIEGYEKRGWRLHTYTCTQVSAGDVNHYLLFERES